MTIRRGQGPRDGDPRDPMARPGDDHPRGREIQDAPPTYRGASPIGGRSSGSYRSSYNGGDYGAGYRSRARRDNRYEDRRGGGLGLLRFLVFLVVLAALVLAVLATIARPLLAAVVVPVAENNNALLSISFVNDLVRDDIGDALTAPANTTRREVTFTVEPGDTPTSIAPRLLSADVIASERAFLFLAREERLAERLRAGRFALTTDMTPAQVITGLIENEIVIVTMPIRFREGLRLEQMTALLETIDGLPFEPREFYELVTEPPASLRSDYPWLEQLPEGATLEGYLYPATYTIRVDDEAPTSAEDLVRMLLDEFEEQVGTERMQVPEERGLTWHQVLTLASIVEREAVLDEERATIAGVYQNRIDRISGVRHGLLQADPTVYYALDTAALRDLEFEQWREYAFWTPKGEALADVPLPEDLEGYNTYRNRGLPPGPICTPSAASIDAALAPEEHAYRFFLAIPEGNGAHVFAKTQAEHDANRAKYGYT